METIKLNDLNDFIVSVTLEGEAYRLRFSWNDRAGIWSMAIRDWNDVTLIQGIRCVPNYPLLQQYRRPDLPPGELMCIVLDDKQASIGREDFINGKASLVYLSEVDVNAAI